MTVVGRNDPCPCGSGRKYKHCHLGKEDDPARRIILPPLDDPDVELPEGPFAVALSSDDLIDEPLDDEEFSDRDVAWAIVEEALVATKKKDQLLIAEEALELDASHPGALFLMGAVEDRNDRAISFFDRAVDAAEQAIAPATLFDTGTGDWLSEDVEFAFYALLHRAVRELRNGRDDAAVTNLELILAYDPSDRLCARTLLALTHMKHRRFELARQVVDLEDAMSSDINYEWTRVLLSFSERGDNLFGRRAVFDAQVGYPESAELLLKYARTNEAAKSDDSRLETLIRTNTPEMKAEPDLVMDAVYLATVAELVRAWRRTPGALDWLKQMIAAGPSIRLDNGRLGDGPRLVNASRPDGEQTCPICGSETTPFDVVIVTEIETGEFSASPWVVDTCSTCDSQIIDPVQFSLTAASENEALLLRDFVSIGYLAAEALTPEPITEDWLAEHLKTWRKVEDVGFPFRSWPSAEEIEQFERQQADLDDLEEIEATSGG